MQNVRSGALKSTTSPDVALICVVASCVGLVMGTAVIALRSATPDPVRSIALAVGLSLLIVNVSAFARNGRWYNSGFALSLYVLLGLTAIGLSPVSRIVALPMALAVLGAALFLRNLFYASQALRPMAVVGLLAFGLFLGTYFAGFYWGGAQHDILYPEAIPVGGVRTDIAEQAAVVNMISTYGIPSTGLDGIIELKYHNGSFWIADALKNLCALPAIDFVAFAFGIFVIPYYTAMWLQFADVLRVRVNATPSLLRWQWWFIAAVALIGLVPFESDFLRTNINLLTLNSDSFALGMALVFAFGGLATSLDQSYPKGFNAASLTQPFAVAIAEPVLLALIGFVKISLLYSVLAVLIYLWLRLPKLRNWAVTLGTTAACVILLLLFRAESGATASSIALFNFDRIHPEWVPYFFLVHYIWLWILVLMWARRERVHTVLDLAKAVRSKRSLPLELVLAAAATGLIPYLVLFFDSGAWGYFTLFHAFLAGAFVLALYSPSTMRQIKSQLSNGTLPLARVATFLVASIVAGHLVIATVSSDYRMIKHNGEIRARLVGNDPAKWRASLHQIGRSVKITQPLLVNRSRVLHCLSDIGLEPARQRRTMALYIPKTNRWYWDMRQQNNPGVPPFIAPAFSGVAMVDGLPEFEDIGYAAVAWGYPQYRLPTRPEPPTYNLERAIADARQKGFKQLVVFKGVSDSGCQMDELSLN